MNCKFVVCGVEHSGTTLISDLFRQVPGLDSGFEVGVLLSEEPKEFYLLEPFAENMLVGWGIEQEELKECCDQKTNDEFYAQLQKHSRDIQPDTKHIFDKTPRYLSELSQCLDKTDCPFVVSYKDPRATVYSDYKRSKSDDFFAWYETYMPRKLQYLNRCYQQYFANKQNSRVHSVGLEDLALNARASMEAMFNHVQLQFNLDYMVMQNLRYENTHSTSVSIPIAFAYVNALNTEMQSAIESDFSDLSDWFYR